MRIMLALTLAALTATGPALARSPCPANVTPGMTYHQARAQLIEAGFQPIATPTDKRGANNSRFMNLGYIEQFDTALTMPETSPMFLWDSGQGKFLVETRGDLSPTVVACDPF